MRAVIHGNANRAPSTVRRITAIDRPSSQTTSPTVAAWPASSGKASMMGTTARSWNSSIDTMVRPGPVPMSPDLSSDHRTRAVEDSATMPPHTAASAAGRPPAMATAKAAPPVSSTCTRAAAENRAAQLPQVAEAQLDADREQQQDDADLGHQFDLVAVTNQTEAAGADQDAGEDEPNYRGYVEPAQQRRSRHCRRHHQHQLRQNRMTHEQSVTFSRASC